MSQGTLRMYLNKKEPYSLSTETILRLALDISRGMEYLHSQGVIHRDLKSNNLLLNDEMRVKVADFGTSCLETQCLETKGNMGTYRWMAPEMIKEKPYTRKVDVYSFGIVLWELMTALLPFQGMTPVQAAFAVAEKITCAKSLLFLKDNDRLFREKFLICRLLNNRLDSKCSQDCRSWHAGSRQSMGDKNPLKGQYFRLLVNERPPLPESCQPALAHLIKRCWAANPAKRPDFSDIVSTLEKYDECVKEGLPLTSHSGLVSRNVILERLKGCVSMSSSIPVQA
ncbi:hypothetical protein Gorai_005100 [Gossypium raimondii]|uniref:Protein kinase domain-containing protein n=1 Tax=Gossypium raimondii TaxID=29730 RepID=A0A7J8QBD5_GOSRA|nr:hypothetical protein [Gossypium raimondii]